MEENRVRIADIADALGLSTATVSNVIHGKTKKISDETVRRVQEKIEELNYIPNMAGILLAQNSSKIVGVVVNDHQKYEGRVLEDGFVAASINALSDELNSAGYFMMVKTTKDWTEISRIASMWNMEGLILIGFCEADYKKLRENMHIPFVVYDGYFLTTEKIVNITIDSYSGGFQAGRYLKESGYKAAIVIADNYTCMDKERIDGFKEGFAPGKAEVRIIPMEKQNRIRFYEEHLQEIKQYHALFAVSDYYAVDFIQFAYLKGINVPYDISVVGFDDNNYCEYTIPPLTTVRQSPKLRAHKAVQALEKMKAGEKVDVKILLPVELTLRSSVIKESEQHHKN